MLISSSLLTVGPAHNLFPDVENGPQCLVHLLVRFGPNSGPGVAGPETIFASSSHQWGLKITQDNALPLKRTPLISTTTGFPLAVLSLITFDHHCRGGLQIILLPEDMTDHWMHAYRLEKKPLTLKSYKLVNKEST